MNKFHVIFTVFLAQFYFHNYYAQEVPAVYQKTIENEKEKLSDYILKVLKHYQQEVPVGLPGAPVPDPLDIPDLSHSFSVGRMNFKNVKLYGLKNFQIEHVKADITAMKVEAALIIRTLVVKGNYTLSTWLSKAAGPFTVTLTDVHAKTIATLEVVRNGQLEAQDMNMDIVFKTIDLNFEGLGFFANMFQGVINSVGIFIFDSIKPFVLSEMNKNVRTDVNTQVRKLGQTFPNSISPFDQLLVTIRHKIRDAKYDPFYVPDYNSSVGVFDIFLTNTWLTGLSSIHRVGDIQFEIANNTVFATLQVGTQKLEGRTNWEVSLITKVLSRTGIVSFSVEYVTVQIYLSQTMDTRNSPKLEDIQLELGNIQVRFDGAGTADYVIEFAINVIPNLLRYQIMDALEYPVKQNIQNELNKINIEQLIEENRDKIDNPDSLQIL